MAYQVPSVTQYKQKNSQPVNQPPTLPQSNSGSIPNQLNNYLNVQDNIQRIPLTQQHQMLINNLRVLEVICRQIINNPSNINTLSQSRSQYLQAIQLQLKPLALDAEQLNRVLKQLNLADQLKNSYSYIVSSTECSGQNMVKLQKFISLLDKFIQIIVQPSVPNSLLKQTIKELIDNLNEILGKEGCPPIGWQGVKLLEEVQCDINNKCSINAGAVESYLEWQDRLNNLYCNQVSDMKWT